MAAPKKTNKMTAPPTPDEQVTESTAADTPVPEEGVEVEATMKTQAAPAKQTKQATSYVTTDPEKVTTALKQGYLVRRKDSARPKGDGTADPVYVIYNDDMSNARFKTALRRIPAVVRGI